MGRSGKSPRNQAFKKPKQQKTRKKALDIIDQKSIHGVYCLWSPQKQRDYPGYTNKPDKRLPKHLGKLKGGAEETANTKDWRYAWFICPFMNESDGKHFEGRVIRQGPKHNPGARLLKALTDLGTAGLKWNDSSLCTALDKRRAPLGKYHVFIFPNLPGLKGKKAAELEALLHKPSDAFVVHRDATIEQIQSYVADEKVRLSALPELKPASVVPFAGISFVPKWGKS